MNGPTSSTTYKEHCLKNNSVGFGSFAGNSIFAACGLQPGASRDQAAFLEELAQRLLPEVVVGDLGDQRRALGKAIDAAHARILDDAEGLDPRGDAIALEENSVHQKN